MDISSHLRAAHALWPAFIHSEAICIDATCGNGHDTLFLAKLGPKVLYAIDIQELAIEQAKALCAGFSVNFVCQSHETFPPALEANTVDLIVYNLGYLPGADKALCTVAKSSLTSIQAAMHLIRPGGLISITLYPGHTEGAKETEAVLDLVRQLPNSNWVVKHESWINRSFAPSLVLLQKRDANASRKGA